MCFQLFYLEAVAILPQLFMISKTGEAESITSHYLFALGMYRGLYSKLFMETVLQGDKTPKNHQKPSEFQGFCYFFSISRGGAGRAGGSKLLRLCARTVPKNLFKKKLRLGEPFYVRLEIE